MFHLFQIKLWKQENKFKLRIRLNAEKSPEHKKITHVLNLSDKFQNLRGENIYY